MRKRVFLCHCKIPMNLQFFAEGGDGAGADGSNGSGSGEGSGGDGEMCIRDRCGRALAVLSRRFNK